MTTPVMIVDDDPAIRDSLVFLFRSRGVAATAWDSAEAFLASGHAERTGCLVLDVRMEGMSGLQLFDRLQAFEVRPEVVFLTGHADVPMAVEALKKGAADFVEKPFNTNELVDRVLAVLERLKARLAERSAEGEERRRREERLSCLSPREREVLDRVVTGAPNKVIAHDLGITERTVEVHRARVLEKMKVRNAVELARLMGRG
ncbi:MAG: response regulator transcription factor [Hyphomicrobiaceae bacterium]|nr:response regulator transcription factor [Hyphomicrobiaceae bacterium]